VTGYLDRLAARLVEPRSHIRPRPLSRFEAVDAPAALVEEVGTAGEAESLPAPPARAQPPRAADDRGDGVRHFASNTPPSVRSIEISADAHTAPAANLVLTEPSALDASTAEAKQVGAPAGHDPVAPTPETVGAPEPHSPASHRAMPAAVPAVVQASPMPKDATTLPPAIEDRISPWRAPVERPAQPAIESRTTAPGPLTTTLPRQRDKPDAQVDDGPSVVQVTIGRLEVRAPEAPRRPAAKPARAAPRMSLQDYLQRRTEGRAR
jgi:hypothetical protein